MLEQLLSSDEQQTLTDKLENQLAPKVEHKSAQALAKRDLNLARLEKQFLKAQVKYEITKQHQEDKKNQKIAAINEKFSAEDLKTQATKQIKIVQELEKFYLNKAKVLSEEFDLLKQNYELAVEDVNLGYENELQRTEKLYIQEWQRKYQVINLKRNIQKYQLSQPDKKAVSKTELKVLVNSQKQEILALCEESQTNWQPFKYKVTGFWQTQKEKVELLWLSTQVKWAQCRQWTWKDWVTVKIWTIPIYLYLVFFGIVAAAIATNTVEENMIYPMGILFVIAILGGTIFSKIPIWKKYIGGGVMGSMFVGAFLVYLNVIPKDSETYGAIKVWFSDQNFLSLYISVLLVGSVLLMPRKMILKATGGFFLVIVAGTAVGVGLGFLASLITGTSFSNLILNYALPILGDGNGGGLQPMKKMAEANGYNSDTWYSQGLAISTLASILSVIMAAILNGVGKVKPSLSGDGKLVQQNIRIVERKPVAKDRNIAAGLILILMIYLLSDLLAEKILTEEVLGVLVPNFAWMIIICLILNLSNVIPAEIKAGTQKVNTFISKQTTWLLMLGVGIVNIDLAEFFAALNPVSLLISVMFVVGGALGCMGLAKLIKFNPIESGISAGLCMTAQGGSGSIACLGASNRMELMPWSQITCRIAGSIVLVFAAVAFAAWPA